VGKQKVFLVIQLMRRDWFFQPLFVLLQV